MRVTILLPRLDMTGGNRVCSMYARLLQEAGHSVVTVVAGPPRRHLRGRLSAFLKRGAIGSMRIQERSHFDNLQLDVRRLDSYRPITDKDVPDADVVVATWWETAEWAGSLSASKGKKVYLVQHHEIFDGLPIERVRATYRLPLQKIVVADWLRDVMRDVYGDQDVKLIPNAIDPKQFFAPIRSKQARPTLGFMSSLAGFKAVDIAVNAIMKVRSEIPDLRVISFGHQLVDGLESLGQDLDFIELPSQDEIRERYCRCDVWLTSSNSEGFNLPALEAMACRTPVVSTRTGWPATSVVDGSNGYLAEVGDWSGLAMAASRVLRSDSETWSSLSTGAWETARPMTWDGVYPAIENALFGKANVVPCEGPSNPQRTG